MCQLDTLWPCGRAAGVVHRAGGVLVRRPTVRLSPGGDRGEETGVAVTVENDTFPGRHLRKDVVVLRVDEEHISAGVLDDVGDLGGVQTEIDRHEHPTRSAHPEERHEKPRRVRAHDRHSPAHRYCEIVERCRHAGRPLAELAVRHGTETTRYTWLVHNPDAVRVDVGRSFEEVRDREGNLHVLYLLGRSG